MIVTISQSCIYIKHEVRRTVRPEIASRRVFSVFHSNLYISCDGLSKRYKNLYMLFADPKPVNNMFFFKLDEIHSHITRMI